MSDEQTPEQPPEQPMPLPEVTSPREWRRRARARWRVTLPSGAVIEATFTKTDTAPTMTGSSIIIGYTNGAVGTEELTVDATARDRL